VTLIGKGKENLTRFVYYMHAVNSKIFFLADVLFLGFALDLDDYIILADTFIWGCS
jgi:hypothetical protein